MRQPWGWLKKLFKELILKMTTHQGAKAHCLTHYLLISATFGAFFSNLLSVERQFFYSKPDLFLTKNTVFYSNWEPLLYLLLLSLSSVSCHKWMLQIWMQWRHLFSCSGLGSSEVSTPWLWRTCQSINQSISQWRHTLTWPSSRRSEVQRASHPHAVLREPVSRHTVNLQILHCQQQNLCIDNRRKVGYAPLPMLHSILIPGVQVTQQTTKHCRNPTKSQEISDLLTVHWVKRLLEIDIGCKEPLSKLKSAFHQYAKHHIMVNCWSTTSDCSSLWCFSMWTRIATSNRWVSTLPCMQSIIISH